ncbi:MAG: alpha/beta hydrolase-fold protein [Spirochaetales bacterium]|nr:alpha/beta hydrolase-fold protein [Spirochaetales bacterium]
MIKNFKKTFLFITVIILASLLYAAPAKAEKGTVVEIYYPTQDYTVPENNLSSQDKYNKHAFVYLPAGYNADDKKTKYPLVILQHGNGGNEWAWGLQDEGEVRRSLDNGISSGKVKKMIVVTTSGVSDKTWQNTENGSSLTGANKFGSELRNDLLPYLKENFNILEGRENTAMAGLSMGAEQTMNIGIGEYLDMFSYFGAFSSIPFSRPLDPGSAYKKPAVYISEVDKAFDSKLKIHLLYMTCGTNDGGFYPGYSDYIVEMPKWKRIEKFEKETIQGAGHEWKVWVNGFDHFIQMIF